jgi:hypothetical protein
MASNTKQPEVLRELFAALGNDPFVITECLARPALSERLTTGFTQEERKGRLALSKIGGNNQTRKVVLADANYVLPTISGATTGCSPDTWAATSITNAPAARGGHTAVWTGSEMIVWGGDSDHHLKTGGRYNPSTDSWTATSTADAPNGREFHTAVWTGSEMIVWAALLAEALRIVAEDTIRAQTVGQPPASPTRPPPGTVTLQSGPAVK